MNIKDDKKDHKHIDKLEIATNPCESALRFQAIFEQAPYGIVIIDTNGKLLEFNEAAHRDLGYSREEFAKLSISDIDPYQSPEEIQDSMRIVLEKGEAEFEVKHRTKAGYIRDVNVITQVVNLFGSKVFQTIWHDITERKQAEKTLSKYSEHLERLVQERTAELGKVNAQLQQDIAMRKVAEQEREKLISELQDAMSRIKTLSGLLPTCAWCRKVRDDDGYWKKVETYIEEHSDASFTHGICPECLQKNDPETYKEYIDSNKESGFA
jgi:PAS domain S-box-containing protein